jgi:MOSC domain-containing protein YiiM
MLNPASPLAGLLHGPMRPGRVTWIGLRPARKVAMHAVATVPVDPGSGLPGDRWQGRASGNRQVTLIQAEHLPIIARFLGRDAVGPDLLRRNILVEGINLLALKGRRFRLGSAVLEATGECHPCSRMEAALGPGGYNAMRGHGGITARILEAGVVTLGDAVEAL